MYLVICSEIYFMEVSMSCYTVHIFILYIFLYLIFLFKRLISCSGWLYNDAVSVLLCCVDHASSNGQRFFPLGFCLQVQMRSEMWHCQLVRAFMYLLKRRCTFDVVLLMSHQRFHGSCISWFSAKPPGKHPSSESDILKRALQTQICRLLNAAKLKTTLFESKWMPSIL